MQPMAETRAQQLPGFYVECDAGRSRDIAQQVCTAVTSMFIEENFELRQQHSEDTTQFLSQQLADAKAKLDEQDAKLAAFKSRYIGALPDEEQTNLNLLTGLTSQLDAATQASRARSRTRAFAESMLTPASRRMAGIANRPEPETLEQQ